jgi:hypothetical protein
MSIHILHMPMEEVDRRSEGERWCFRCRKRREFEYVISAPIGLTYYGPTEQVECTHCGMIDGDLFPGYGREWA